MACLCVISVYELCKEIHIIIKKYHKYYNDVFFQGGLPEGSSLQATQMAPSALHVHVKGSYVLCLILTVIEIIHNYAQNE